MCTCVGACDRQTDSFDLGHEPTHPPTLSPRRSYNCLRLADNLHTATRAPPTTLLRGPHDSPGHLSMPRNYHEQQVNYHEQQVAGLCRARRLRHAEVGHEKPQEPIRDVDGARPCAARRRPARTCKRAGVVHLDRSQQRGPRLTSAKHVLGLLTLHKQPVCIGPVNASHVLIVVHEVGWDADATTHRLCRIYFPPRRRPTEAHHQLINAHHGGGTSNASLPRNAAAPCAPPRWSELLITKLVYHAPICLRRAASRRRSAEHGEGAADRTKQLSSPGRQRQLRRGDKPSRRRGGREGFASTRRLQYSTVQPW